jgi:hypothetical protein
VKQVFDKKEQVTCGSEELGYGELGEIVSLKNGEPCDPVGSVITRTFYGLVLLYHPTKPAFETTWSSRDVFIVRKLGKGERVILTNEES